MNWYKKIPLQRKIMAACLIVILIPLTIFVILILNRSIHEERKQMTVRLVQANEVINDRLSTTINNIKTTSAMYLVYPEVIGYVKNNFHMDQPDYVLTLREMKKNVMSVRINPYTSSITYLSNDKHAYSGAGYNEKYLNSLYGFAEEMEEEKIKNMISPVYETVINQQSVRAITYCFALVDPYSFEKVGYGFINLDLKQLGQNFQVFTQQGSTHTMAIQGNYAVYKEEHITDPMAEQIMASLAEADIENLIKDQGSTILDLKLEEGSYRCAASYHEALDLTIVSIADEGVLKEEMMQGMMYYFVILGIMLAVFVGVSVVLSINMTKPVRVLEEGMHQVEQGALVPITRELDRQDDLGKLIHGFNHMVVRLRESIIREYESENLQKKAQIMMLESQINPHFLYNTLNVINSIAIIEDVPEISKLSTNLGDMFRYNINGSSIIAVKEEITQIKRYTEIQNLCMGNKIDMIYSVSKEVEDWKILKFLLQPLVENCFEHGFSGRVRDGHIKVGAEWTEQGLRLSVEDNGAGMEPDRLAFLTERCMRPGVACLEKDPEDSIGLLNVNFRLKNYYGEAYGLQIESEPGIGTKIIMEIPEKID